MRIIDEALRGLAIGAPIRCGNLSMFPLFGSHFSHPGYVTLDEALHGGDATITEVAKCGRVPFVRFVSQSPIPIFLLDGQELIGAMQDRVLNISLIVPPRRKLAVPVTCVEAARWEPSSESFTASPRVHFATGRAEMAAQVTESLLCGGVAESDQVEVWSTLEEIARRLDAQSPTRAHSALFVRHALRIEAAVRDIRPRSGQTGAAMAAGGDLLGMDLFDNTDTFAQMLPKLVRSAAVDAVGISGTPPTCEDVAVFIDKTARARRLRFAALGIGVDVRLSGDRIAGGALTAWGRLIHLAAFPVDGGDQAPDADRREVAK